MINIKIICVGKVKEKSLNDLIQEYSKRLSKYCKLEIIELEDEKIPSTPSLATEEIIREKESNKIIDRLNKIGKAYTILLDVQGKSYTSEEFSQKIVDISTYENSTINFVIGGSLGFSSTLKNMINDKISFSKMTFPHQLFRVFLLEQIFRAFKIQNNETYHK